MSESEKVEFAEVNWMDVNARLRTDTRVVILGQDPYHGPQQARLGAGRDRGGLLERRPVARSLGDLRREHGVSLTTGTNLSPHKGESLESPHD